MSRSPAPRLLTKEQAADYIGVSVPTFTKVCNVAPIALGAGKRLIRYDIKQLNIWIDGLSQTDTLEDSDYWLERFENDDERQGEGR
ncbi:hypothetical protein [Methylocystis sp.]|uniref:hypothetical protein n=1 Tax=Methylocystis sp. TaxID=1911079 RepID=UPI003DA626A4